MPEDFDLSDNPLVPNYYGNPTLGKEARSLYSRISKYIDSEIKKINEEIQLSSGTKAESKITIEDLILISKDEFTELYVDRFSNKI